MSDDATTTEDPDAALSYEEARDELVEVVRALEGGGTSLADNLSAGLDRFLKDAGAFIQNVFGGERK